MQKTKETILQVVRECKTEEELVDHIYNASMNLLNMGRANGVKIGFVCGLISGAGFVVGGYFFKKSYDIKKELKELHEEV